MQLKQIGIDHYGTPLFIDPDEFPEQVRWVANRFLIRLVEEDELSVRFKVFEADTWYDLGAKGSLITGNGYPDDYASGWFRYDGFSQFNFDESGVLSLAAGREIAKHFILLRAMFDWAYELLKGKRRFVDCWDKDAVDSLFGGAR